MWATAARPVLGRAVGRAACRAMAPTTRPWSSAAGRARLSRAVRAPAAATPTPRRTLFAMPSGDAAPVIGGLIAANVGVWGAWKVVDDRVMAKHFTLCSADVAGRPHTLVTSFFSHRDGWHLAGNCMTLFFFGPEVVGALGAAAFLCLYCGAGVLAGGAQLASHAYANSQKPAYWRRPSDRCLGASGAVNAAVAYSCLLSPWRLIILFAEFIPVPMPAILYGGAFLAKDLGPLLDIHIPYVSDRAHGIAHGAHVGGTAVREPASSLLSIDSNDDVFFT